MFGLQLDNDEWGLVACIAYLGLRVLSALGMIAWQFINDASTAIGIKNKYLAIVRFGMLPTLTAAVVGIMAVCLVSIGTGGPRPDLRDAIYVASGFSGLVLGIFLEAFVFIRLYKLSIWIGSFRVPQYRERLQSADPATRLLAAERLLGLGTRALPARMELLSAMRDESPDVRTTAAMAVFYAIPDPPPEDDRDTPTVARRMLADLDSRVRVIAAGILVKFRAAPVGELLPILIEGMSLDNLTALIAVTMLGHLGPEAAPAIPAFRAAILERELAYMGAIEALGSIGEEAVPLLIEILEAGELSAKWAATDALGKMGAQARTALPALQRLARSDLTGFAAKKAIRKIKRTAG